MFNFPKIKCSSSTIARNAFVSFERTARLSKCCHGPVKTALFFSFFFLSRAPPFLYLHKLFKLSDDFPFLGGLRSVCLISRRSYGNSNTCCAPLSPRRRDEVILAASNPSNSPSIKRKTSRFVTPLKSSLAKYRSVPARARARRCDFFFLFRRKINENSKLLKRSRSALLKTYLRGR